MVFSSILFLLYFLPVFLAVYVAVPYRAKNAVALTGSMLFYMWGAPIFCFILVASSAIDFALAHAMNKGDQSRKKTLLWIGLLVNLGLLGYFKYANFFIDNVNAILEASGSGPVGWAKVALPIGLSFFTFQKISFLVDVYRGETKPMKWFFGLPAVCRFVPAVNSRSYCSL